MTRTSDGRGRERHTGTILPSVLSAREHGCPPPRPDTLPPRRGGGPSSKTASAAARPAGLARFVGARRSLIGSARAVAAVACLCLAGPLALPAQTQTTNFYLWRTTITVGVLETPSLLTIQYGYFSSRTLGSISTDADFGYPPWNPPHKHHVDRDGYITVGNIVVNENTNSGIKSLLLTMPELTDTGEVTLWLDHKNYPLTSASYGTTTYTWDNIQNNESTDLNWKADDPGTTDVNEADQVRVALVYERRLPSAPKNVSVTAPPGEDGTLEVSWDEPDDEGTFPIECYLVEFRHPSGEAKKRKQSYPGSLGPGKGCGDSPPTSVRRTDLETGVQYQVLVQALSGDGFSEWSETKTVRANGRSLRSDLTASFVGMPAKHDGERAFRFRVAFSENIGISFRALRQDAFTVTGGRITRGKRVDGRRDLFRMTVRPDSDGDVTITLPAGRECATSGAICTKGENRRQLTNSPSATVKGPAASSAAAAAGWPDRAARLCSALAAGDGLTPSSAAAALWGDGDPGPLHVRLTAPAQARDIGAMLIVEGPAIDSLQAPGLEMFETEESSSTRREVIIAGALPDAPVLRVWVPHRGDEARYRVRLLQVAGEDFALRDLSVYGSVISR